MSRLPSISKTEFLILELLVRRREMYGLEMVKESQGLKRGSVYVLLGRLEDKGLVRSRKIPSAAGGLPRRIYSLTSTGAKTQQAAAAAQSVFGLDFPLAGGTA